MFARTGPKTARHVSLFIAFLVMSSLAVAASLSLSMYLKPADSETRNPLLLVSSILQYALLGVLLGRANGTLFVLFYKHRIVDVLMTFHAVFPSFIITSIWVHQMMVHNSRDLAKLTADAVISNIATAVVVSVLYVRTASATATKLMEV
jgi:hypothetical protein